MYIYLITYFTFLFLLTNNTYSQCVATNQSSTQDYAIQITASSPDLDIIGDFGTSWNIQFSYDFDISFSGTEIPEIKGKKSVLYNIQTYVYCDHIQNGETYIDNLESIKNGGNARLYSPIKPTVDYISAIINKPSADAVYEDFGCTLMSRMSGPGITDTFVPFVCNTILPIELSYFNLFKLKYNNVKINWETKTELNNDFFTIERAVDDLKWEKIAFIKGSGSSNQANFYQYIDKNPSNGNNYYRLKQTDYSGTEKTSPPKLVNIINENLISLYPTIVRDFVTIQNIEGEEIKIYSSGGKLQLHLTEKKTNNSIKIDTKHLEKGIYFVKINDNTLKFIKK